MSENETSSIDEPTAEDSVLLTNERIEETPNSEEMLKQDGGPEDPGRSEDEWEKPSANSSIVSIISGKTIDSLQLFKILKFQEESLLENTSSESLVQTNNGPISGDRLRKKENENINLSPAELEVDLINGEEIVDH